MAKDGDSRNKETKPYLTERELEILRLTVTGLSDKAIAAELRIETGTVHTHQEHLREKFGVKNRIQMVVFADHLGLASAADPFLPREAINKAESVISFSAILELAPDEFERRAGISREAFMVLIENLAERNEAKGHPCKLSLEDQLLLTLMHCQRRRTLSELGEGFGISEATACRIARKIMSVLGTERMETLRDGRNREVGSEPKIVGDGEMYNG